MQVVWRVLYHDDVEDEIHGEVQAQMWVELDGIQVWNEQ